MYISPIEASALFCVEESRYCVRFSRLNTGISNTGRRIVEALLFCFLRSVYYFVTDVSGQRIAVIQILKNGAVKLSRNVDSKPIYAA